MILVVDYDYVGSMVKNSLEKAGLFISSFTDPLLALEKFRSDTSIYNLVIPNILMPVKDGCKLTRLIKKDKT